MYARTRERGFGAEVKRRIMLGTYVLSAGYYEAYYLKAQQVRTLILRDYDQAFERADVRAPCRPARPPPSSWASASRIRCRCTSPTSSPSARISPACPPISVPCGFTTDRLPIGLQLTGRRFDETTLLRIADAYERDTDWWQKVPEIPHSLEVRK